MDDTIISERYILHEVIGKGGMGTVYAATDIHINKVVALKRVAMLESELLGCGTTKRKQREAALIHEFETLTTLDHPHIVHVLDYGIDADDCPYFTMEYLKDAQSIVIASQDLAVVDRLELIRQLFAALDYLHKFDILHRDLKPNNILVVNQNVYLIDFGLASTSSDIQETVGTLTYMSPELLQGQPIDLRADLYSAGVIGYEMLVGVHPCQCSTVKEFIRAVVYDAPNFEVLPDMGEKTDDLVMIFQSLLAKNPMERYPSAAAVLEDLYNLFD